MTFFHKLLKQEIEMQLLQFACFKEVDALNKQTTQPKKPKSSNKTQVSLWWIVSSNFMYCFKIYVRNNLRHLMQKHPVCLQGQPSTSSKNNLQKQIYFQWYSDTFWSEPEFTQLTTIFKWSPWNFLQCNLFFKSFHI